MSWLDVYFYSVAEHGLPCPEHEMEGVLDALERERLQRFRREDPRQLFLIARYLLKTRLAEHLHCAAQAVRLRYNDNGKPLLAEGTGLHISLSHTQGGVALCVSDRPCGVDLERLSRVQRPWRHAGRYLHPTLALRVAEENSEAAASRCFFQYWTALEATVKREGSGLFRLRENFGAQGLEFDAEGRAFHDGYWLYTKAVAEDLQLSVSTEVESGVTWWHFDGEEFFRED